MDKDKTDLEKYRQLLIETNVQFEENKFDDGKILIIPSDIIGMKLEYVNYGTVGLDVKLIFNKEGKLFRFGAWA